METIFSNPGLSIIAIDIFKEFDPNSLLKARLVCKSWKSLIDCSPKLQDKPFIQKKKKLLEFVSLESVNQLTEKWPAWQKILSHFLNHRSFEDILKLGQILQNYFAQIQDTFDPLLAASNSDEWDTVEFLLLSVKDLNYIENVIGTVLQNAFNYKSGNVPSTIYSIIDKALNEIVFSKNLEFF